MTYMSNNGLVHAGWDSLNAALRCDVVRVVVMACALEFVEEAFHPPWIDDRRVDGHPTCMRCIVGLCYKRPRRT